MYCFTYFRRRCLIIGLLALFINPNCFSQPVNEGSDGKLVASWNQLIMEMAVAEDGLLTLKGVRTASMAHVAMHDALNSIIPRFTYYAYDGEKPGADPVASAAKAAYEVVVDQYPDQDEVLLMELNKWLDLVDNPQRKKAGIDLGSEVARVVLNERSTDRWDEEAEYSWHPMGPGVYAEFHEHSNTPEGFVFGAGWAKADPFMIPSSSYFRVQPPPKIKSDEYTKAYNEVKKYGGVKSGFRSPDQTHLAMWAKDFIENSHNRLARKLVVDEGLNLWQAARLFALMNMSIYDAYVNVFDNKFIYNHWRPYTAIHWAEHDGNPDTEPDTTWNTMHRHTYAFPSYPSAHGAASGAAMTVLAQTLGRGDKYEFTMRIAEVDEAGPFSGKIKMDPPTRTFTRFSEAAMAFALSRIYLGIHFKYDSVQGYKLGKMTGDYAVQHFLTPVAKIESGQ